MVSLNAIVGVNDIGEHINLFVRVFIIKAKLLLSISLPVPISCLTITSDSFTESITLISAVRVLAGNQVKNSEIDLLGGDCAMQEIVAEQESGAQGIAKKKYGSKCPKLGNPCRCGRCGCRLLPGEVTHNTYERQMGNHNSYYCNRCYGKDVAE